MRLAGVSAAIAIAGCGRIAFDELPDAGAPALRSCANAWMVGPQFGVVDNHPELVGANNEFDPFLVRGDPLTLYFASDRTSINHIYVARRASVGQPFDPPVNVAALAGTGEESALIYDAAKQGGVYAASGSLGGPLSFYDVNGSSGTLARGRRYTELEMDPRRYDPFPSSDGLTFVFASGVDTNSLDLYTARRTTPQDLWTDVQLFVHSAPGATDAGASMTADERVIVWTRDAGTTQAIYYAVRADRSLPWGPEQLLMVASNDEGEPSLREDGCELLFCSVAGGFHIRSVEVLNGL